MKIDINDHRKLFAIQQEFEKLFPNLKLEFYKKPSHSKSAHPEKIIHTEAKTLGECRSVHAKGSLTITPNMTVAELESNFDEIYGVHVDILKRSGSAWVAPEAKNTLTLTEQNNN